MSLTLEEQQELASLDSRYKGLSRDEALELDALEKKYGGGSQKPNSAPSYEVTRTLQEMHPDVTTGMRAVLKNFSNSPESGLKYLKQELPNDEVDYYNSQYRVRKPGEKDYRVVDPDTGIFSTDILNDALDVAYDIPAGALEGGAAALGAVGGSAIAPGVGTLGGAALGGGAMSAADEAIRQKFGQYLGIPQEVSGTDVAISGAVGSLSPLLMGAGKAKGLIPEAYGVVRNGMAPYIGSKLSGVTPEALKSYAKNMGQVDDLSKNGIEDFTGKAFDKISDYANTQRDDATKNLIDVIEGSGKQVNMAPAKASFTNPMTELQASPLMTQSDQGKVQQMKAALEKYLGLASKGPETPVQLIPDQIPASDAWKIQKDLKQAAKFGTDVTPEDLYSKGSARGAYSNINKALQEAIGDAAPEAKKRYADAIRFEEEMLPKFEGKTRLDSIQKTYNTLSGLDRNSKKVLQERLSSLAKQGDGALDLTNEAEILGAYKQLGKPALMPVSSGGTTSTSRTIPLALLGGSLGSLAGYNSGGGYAGATAGGLGGAALGTMLGSPAAMRNYIKAVLKSEQFGRTVKDRISGLAAQLGMPEESLAREAARLGLTTEAGKSVYEDMTAPEFLMAN